MDRLMLLMLSSLVVAVAPKMTMTALVVAAGPVVIAQT
jgi:hypothetical protein